MVASELLKEQPPALERLTAHQALALSLEARGDLAASLEQHRVAEGIAIRCAHPGLGVDICWVSQVYLACGLGDREAFERATRAIDASGVVLSATAESLLLSWDGPPVSNVLGNGARLTGTELQKALERGGPVTARIINALL